MGFYALLHNLGANRPSLQTFNNPPATSSAVVSGFPIVEFRPESVGSVAKRREP